MSLIKRDPCECCEDRKTIHPRVFESPPYDICQRTGSDDFDCDATRFAAALAETAESVAEALSAIDDDAVLREIAEGVGDAFANGLYLRGIDAEFDAQAFVVLVCGTQNAEAQTELAATA